MTITSVCAVYFSATGKTKLVTEMLALRLAESFGIPMRTVDFTLPPAREQLYNFGPDELVVFGMPTYAGKLPNKILPFVKEGFRGEGTPAAALVTFGNRSFDNSLAELCRCLQEAGFLTFAAGALACEHAFTPKLAGGRPDADDMAAMERFADTAAEKLRRSCVTGAKAGSDRLPAASEGSPYLMPASVPGDPDAPYYTPRGLDGEPKKFLKAVPQTDPALCDRCGRCAALCPMGSIDPADPASVTGICIKCHACVRSCPKGAKYFDDEAFLSHRAMLERDYGSRRAEPQFFL